MSEIENKIKECIAEIEPYRIYASESHASEIDLAVKSLKEVDDLIKNLNEENAKRALEIVTEFLNRNAAYSSYIPRTASNLQFIKEWLKKQKETG